MAIDNEFGKGIGLAAGFDLGAQKPLDSRLAVNTMAERDAHVENNRAYEGMLVYVAETSKTYQLVKGEEEGQLVWQEFGITDDFNSSILEATAQVETNKQDIADLKEAVGNENAGLVKDVADLQEVVGVPASGEGDDAVVASGLHAAIADEVADRVEADNALQGKIDAINNEENGILAQAKAHAEAQDAAQKELLDAEDERIAGLVAKEQERAEKAEQDLQGEIDAITAAGTGILDVAKGYADAQDVVLANSVKSVTDDHETRIGKLENNDEEQDGRLTAIEADIEKIFGGDVKVDLKGIEEAITNLGAKDTELEGKITAIEEKDEAQDGKISALEGLVGVPASGEGEEAVAASGLHKAIADEQARAEGIEAGLDAAVKAAQGAADKAQEEVDALELKVADDEADIKTLQDQMAALNDGENSIGTQLNNLRVDLEGQVQAVADDLADEVDINVEGSLAAKIKANDDAIKQEAQDRADAVGQALEDAKDYADGLDTQVRADFAKADGELEGRVNTKIDTDIAAAIAQEVIDRNAAIKVEADRAVAKENEINAAVVAEAERAAGEEAKIRQEMADAIGNYAVEADPENNVEAVDAKGLRKEIADAVKAEADLRVAKDNELDQAIKDEAAARLEKDNELAGEIAKMKNADEEGSLQAQINANKDALDILNGDADVEGSVKKQIADAIGEVNGAAADLEGRVAANEAALEKINGADNVEGSIAKAEKDAKDYADQQIAALVDGAPETLDTLNELAAALRDNENVLDAVEQAFDNKLDALKLELQGEIDSDVAAEAALRVAEEAKIRQELADEKAALQKEIDDDIAAERVIREAAEKAIQDAVDVIEEQLGDKEGGLVARLEALEAANEEGGAVSVAISNAQQAADDAKDAADAAQSAADAAQAAADALEEKVGHDVIPAEGDVAEQPATGLFAEIDEINAALEQEVEDRNQAIANALEAYSTTEEMKAILGNVVNSLALVMENDQVVLKLGGAEGIELTSVALDVATDDDIDALLAELDEAQEPEQGEDEEQQ